jgi:hypothetical protein
MISCKTTSTPPSSTSKLLVHEGEPLGPNDASRYQSLVGALQYHTLTCPDISFSVNKVYQYLHGLTTIHLKAVKRIIRFLKHTLGMGLNIRQSSSTMVSAFSDADRVGCTDDRKSTGGFAVFLGLNLVSWYAKKQKIVSCLSTEAEYKAMTDATTEITWVQSILNELRNSCPQSARLWCDNMGAKFLSSNPIFHGRMKHVEVDYHFIRDEFLRSF